MKLFLKNTCTFLIIPLVASPFIAMVLDCYISKNVDYKIPHEVSSVFIGDSHVQVAIADSLLAEGKNIATSSESFYFSYYKLQKLLAANKQIDRVYLGFSYHSLSNYYDKFIFGEYSASISPKYFFMLPAKEQYKFIRYNFKALPAYSRSIAKVGAMLLSDTISYIESGYVNGFGDLGGSKKAMDTRLEFQFYSKRELNKFSKINLLYLDKIVELCKNKNVDIIILNTPLHPYYKSKLPEAYIKKYQQVIEQYSFRLIDFSDLILADDCFIPDGDHVSGKGALKLTSIFVLGSREEQLNIQD